MPDHSHIFISLKPDIAVSDLVRDIKSNSSSFIKEKGMVNSVFSWQAGFGAFSYSKSQAKRVVDFVLNQPKHHTKKTIKEEYVDFLEKYEIEYDEKYLFEFYDKLLINMSLLRSFKNIVSDIDTNITCLWH